VIVYLDRPRPLRGVSARPRPRGRFRNADESRSRILAAALAEFAASGYRGATVGAIAARAGMSQSGLLHHFPSKELLLAAVIEQRNIDHREEFLRAVDEDPGLGFLTGMVRLMRRAASELDLTRLLTVVIAEATSPEHPAHAWAIERYVVTTDLVVDAFHSAQRQGILRDDFDAAEVSSTLLAAMDGLQLRHLLSTHGMRIEHAFAQLAGQVVADLAAPTPKAAATISAWRARHERPA
jgi:AcrR family transcriptional regulator